jgi:SAM-dependent methyltransferase
MRMERLIHRLRNRPDIGSLRRTTPVSIEWGLERGQVVVRYYIEKFLAEHAADVRGHVLEFSDDGYTRRFGGAQATKVDVLHLTDGNPCATIVADLEQGGSIPSDTFDCIVCTQVFEYVYDLRAAIQTLYRILKPGGIVLVTVPGFQKFEGEEERDFWRFTSLSLRRLFEEAFPKDHLEVRTYGNVLTATAFLYGLAVEDLRRQDLDYHDPEYEVMITLRGVKPEALLSKREE